MSITIQLTDLVSFASPYKLKKFSFFSSGKRSSFFLKVVSLSQKNDSDINIKFHILYLANWYFNKDVFCDYVFYDNMSFSIKYNNMIPIPQISKSFIKWFNENKNNISNLNISNNEILDIDNYLNDFDNKEKELL